MFASFHQMHVSVCFSHFRRRPTNNRLKSYVTTHTVPDLSLSQAHLCLKSMHTYYSFIRQFT